VAERSGEPAADFGHAGNQGERPRGRQHVECKIAVTGVQQAEQRLREERVAEFES
jgi:hypothetical protein